MLVSFKIVVPFSYHNRSLFIDISNIPLYTEFEQDLNQPTIIKSTGPMKSIPVKPISNIDICIATYSEQLNNVCKSIHWCILHRSPAIEHFMVNFKPIHRVERIKVKSNYVDFAFSGCNQKRGFSCVVHYVWVSAEFFHEKFEQFNLVKFCANVQNCITVWPEMNWNVKLLIHPHLILDLF